MCFSLEMESLVQINIYAKEYTKRVLIKIPKGEEEDVVVSSSTKESDSTELRPHKLLRQLTKDLLPVSIDIESEEVVQNKTEESSAPPNSPSTQKQTEAVPLEPEESEAPKLEEVSSYTNVAELVRTYSKNQIPSIKTVSQASRALRKEYRQKFGRDFDRRGPAGSAEGTDEYLLNDVKPIFEQVAKALKL